MRRKVVGRGIQYKAMKIHGCLASLKGKKESKKRGLRTGDPDCAAEKRAGTRA